VASFAGRKRVVGRALWEGTPELPVHPSPAAFKFLHSLISSMATAGSDLWSPVAVAVLKRHLRDDLAEQWSPVLDSMDTKGEIQTNGHKSDDNSSEDADDVATGIASKAEAETIQDTQTK
jgi:hypothetical protein